MQIDGFGSGQTQSGAMDLFVEKQAQAKQAEPDVKEITLGRTALTQKGWNNLLKNIDDYLEMVKAEQKLYLEKLKEDAQIRKINAKLEWKAKDQRERLLKEADKRNIKKQILERNEHYMATPEERAEGEYEISDKDTGQTYKFKTNME